MLLHFNVEVQCDAIVIGEPCELRDSGSDPIISRKKLNVFIEMLFIE